MMDRELGSWGVRGGGGWVRWMDGCQSISGLGLFLTEWWDWVVGSRVYVVGFQMGVFRPLQLSGTAHLVMRPSSPGSLSASASRGLFFFYYLLSEYLLFYAVKSLGGIPGSVT